MQLLKNPSLNTDLKSRRPYRTLIITCLMSIGQLCDDNCKILLTKKKLYVVKESDIVL